MGEIFREPAHDVLSAVYGSEAADFSGEEVDFRNPHLAGISRALASGVIFCEIEEHGSLSADAYDICVSLGLLEAEVQACIDSGLMLPFPSPRGEVADFMYPYDINRYDKVFEMWTPKEDKGTACIVGGKFDFLTIAHVNYVRMLKDLFDTVIVVLASDRECRAFGGQGKPVWPFAYRVANLRTLGVDKIVEGGDVLELIDLQLPFPLFCLAGHISTRLEVGVLGTRLVMRDPASLFYQGYPAVPNSLVHHFSEEEIMHPKRTIAGNPEIARSVEITRESLPYTDMAYCVTEGDPRFEYKRFIAAISGMDFRMMPNRFPDVHSSDVVRTFGIMGLDDVRELL